MYGNIAPKRAGEILFSDKTNAWRTKELKESREKLNTSMAR